MDDSDEAARKARADDLRKDIERRKAGKNEPPPDDTAADETEESPLEFIDRRMRELDGKIE